MEWPRISGTTIKGTPGADRRLNSPPGIHGRSRSSSRSGWVFRFSKELAGGRTCALRGVPTAFLLYRLRGRDVTAYVSLGDHLDRFMDAGTLHDPLMDEAGEVRVAALRSGPHAIGAAGADHGHEFLTLCRAYGNRRVQPEVATDSADLLSDVVERVAPDLERACLDAFPDRGSELENPELQGLRLLRLGADEGPLDERHSFLEDLAELLRGLEQSSEGDRNAPARSGLPYA